MKLTNIIRDAFVRAAMSDVPSIDYSEKIRVVVQADAIAQLPQKIKAVYADPEINHFIRTKDQYLFGGYVRVPSGHDPYKPSEKIFKSCSAFAEEAKVQNEKLNELKQKIHACAYACSTRKQLVEMLPEFEKYLPEDEAAANRSLPVVANVVSEFVKAGWPKGGKKQSKTK